MGCFPLRQTTSTFNPKSLQVDLVSEITFIKCDECVKKSSISTLNIPHIEHLPKNDPKHFIYFLCSKFSSLRELSLDDELDDGNPVEIKKIDINKKIFPKKSNHVKFSKIKNKESKIEKNKKTIHRTSIQFSSENFIKDNLYKIDDLKDKYSSGKIGEFDIHERNFKSPKALKFRHQHKHSKINKNKNKKLNPSLSTIKSKSDCENDFSNNENGQKNVKDSLDPIRAILKEMGN